MSFSGPWEKALNLKIRNKTVIHADAVNQNIIDLLECKAGTVLGDINDKNELNYTKCISPLHIVEEMRFDPVIKGNKLRLRICLDQSILNSATKIISFPLITGEEISQSLYNFDSAISIYNKKSYYLAFLGPLCMPFLAFRWLNLILTFNVAVFGLVNSPSFNEIFQQIFKFELKDILSQNNFINHNLKDFVFGHLS